MSSSASSLSVLPSSATMTASMKKRFVALLRKAHIKDTDPHAIALLDYLLPIIKTKRDYENALGSEEAAENFCTKHKLPMEQHQMFLSMQMAKDIFTPNPILDGILTFIFILQIILVTYEMYSRGLGLLFLILCFLIDAVVYRVKYVSTAVGNWLSINLHKYGYVDAPPLAGKIQMKKWQEQSWQFFVHVTMTIMEFVILYEEEWWRDTTTVWVPHPFEQRGRFRTDLQILYITQLAIWIYTCFIHRFMDERRKDYFVMYTHHIVTIALVGVSWAVGYMRIGLLVLWIHDVSDIFVDTLKMVNYLKLEGPKGFFGVEISYVMCVLSWLYWRLYQYPFRVIHASLVVPFTLLLKTPRYPIRIPYLDLEYFPADLPYHFESNVLLLLLLGMHIYWFQLFLMIGYRILTESTREASRQEYEGDSDEEDADNGSGSNKPGLTNGSTEDNDEQTTNSRQSTRGKGRQRVGTDNNDNNNNSSNNGSAPNGTGDSSVKNSTRRRR